MAWFVSAAWVPNHTHIEVFKSKGKGSVLTLYFSAKHRTDDTRKHANSIESLNHRSISTTTPAARYTTLRFSKSLKCSELNKLRACQRDTTTWSKEVRNCSILIVSSLITGVIWTAHHHELLCRNHLVLRRGFFLLASYQWSHRVFVASNPIHNLL